MRPQPQQASAGYLRVPLAVACWPGLSGEAALAFAWLWERCSFTPGTVHTDYATLASAFKRGESSARRWIAALRKAKLIELDEAHRGRLLLYVSDPAEAAYGLDVVYDPQLDLLPPEPPPLPAAEPVAEAVESPSARLSLALNLTSSRSSSSCARLPSPRLRATGSGGGSGECEPLGAVVEAAAEALLRPVDHADRADQVERLAPRVRAIFGEPGIWDEVIAHVAAAVAYGDIALVHLESIMGCLRARQADGTLANRKGYILHSLAGLFEERKLDWPFHKRVG